MNQEKSTLSRELALVRVTAEHQEEALSVIGAWSGRLIELREGHFTAEVSGTPERLNQCLAALSQHGHVTAVRSGALSLG